jgi:hypothetical protein
MVEKILRMAYVDFEIRLANWRLGDPQLSLSINNFNKFPSTLTNDFILLELRQYICCSEIRKSVYKTK